VTSVAVVAAVLIVGNSRQANVENLRAEKVLSAVAASPDPLGKALLLVELQGAKEPPGGLAVAKEVAAAPLPAAVLRGPSRPVLGIAFSRRRFPAQILKWSIASRRLRLLAPAVAEEFQGTIGPRSLRAADFSRARRWASASSTE
jgi:hypothetical protein